MCIAKSKTCNNGGLVNHFAKVCRKQKKTQKAQNLKKKSVNTVEKPHAEDLVKFLQSLWRLYESDHSSGDDNMFARIHNDHEKIEPLNMPIKIANTSTTLLVDSGGSSCFFGESQLSESRT